jgi:hypothetical protein
MAFVAVQLRLEDEDREVLDAFRRSYADPPSRAIAAKRLFRKALLDWRIARAADSKVTAADAGVE